MFINMGARNLLLQGERQRFLKEQWPQIQATIQRLGLSVEELLPMRATEPASAAARAEEPDTAKEEAKS